MAAFLNRNELLALRLYSGPAYQPINEFLRQLAVLRGEYRSTLARSPHLTFATTVGHICDGIRKLAATVTSENAEAPLYRGVRGELPGSVWQPDKSGLYCVCDTAFMSTSKNKATPVDYMSNTSGNVLWELQPSLESDIAFHRGADISMLSQFKAEDEVLFPPCTLLVFQPRASHQSVSSCTTKKRADTMTDLGQELQVDESSDNGKTFLSIKVRPHFV